MDLKSTKAVPSGQQTDLHQEIMTPDTILTGDNLSAELNSPLIRSVGGQR